MAFYVRSWNLIVPLHTSFFFRVYFRGPVGAFITLPSPPYELALLKSNIIMGLYPPPPLVVALVRHFSSS